MSFDLNLLTSKQKKVYYAIESFIKLKGIPPTVRDLSEVLGEVTPGGVQGVLNRLEQKGVIKRDPGMARSIQLVNDDSKYINPVFIPEIRKINRRNIDDLLSVYNIIKFRPIDPDMIDSNKDCFMLDYHNNILPESNMPQRTTIIISKGCSLIDGDIVLILYENHVLLREYSLTDETGLISLKAENNFKDKEVFKIDEVSIVGRLVGKYVQY